MICADSQTRSFAALDALHPESRLSMGDAVGLGPSNVYRKPGGTQATYDKDIADCQRNATSGQNESKQDAINRCMMSKGWIVTRERN